MANHKSSEKSSSDCSQARTQPSFPQDGTKRRESTPQHDGQECGRGTSPEGYFDAGQAGQAQYRAQEQSRQPEKFVADACKRLVRDCYPMLKFKSRQNLTALRYLYRFTEILLFE